MMSRPLIDKLKQKGESRSAVWDYYFNDIKGAREKLDYSDDPSFDLNEQFEELKRAPMRRQRRRKGSSKVVGVQPAEEPSTSALPQEEKKETRIKRKAKNIIGDVPNKIKVLPKRGASRSKTSKQIPLDGQLISKEKPSASEFPPEEKKETAIKRKAKNIIDDVQNEIEVSPKRGASKPKTSKQISLHTQDQLISKVEPSASQPENKNSTRNAKRAIDNVPIETRCKSNSKKKIEDVPEEIEEGPPKTGASRPKTSKQISLDRQEQLISKEKPSTSELPPEEKKETGIKRKAKNIIDDVPNEIKVSPKRGASKPKTSKQISLHTQDQLISKDEPSASQPEDKNRTRNAKGAIDNVPIETRSKPSKSNAKKKIENVPEEMEEAPPKRDLSLPRTSKQIRTYRSAKKETKIDYLPLEAEEKPSGSGSKKYEKVYISPVREPTSKKVNTKEDRAFCLSPPKSSKKIAFQLEKGKWKPTKSSSLPIVNESIRDRHNSGNPSNSYKRIVRNQIFDSSESEDDYEAPQPNFNESDCDHQPPQLKTPPKNSAKLDSSPPKSTQRIQRRRIVDSSESEDDYGPLPAAKAPPQRAQGRKLQSSNRLDESTLSETFRDIRDYIEVGLKSEVFHYSMQVEKMTLWTNVAELKKYRQLEDAELIRLQYYVTADELIEYMGTTLEANPAIDEMIEKVIKSDIKSLLKGRLLNRNGPDAQKWDEKLGKEWDKLCGIISEEELIIYLVLVSNKLCEEYPQLYDIV